MQNQSSFTASTSASDLSILLDGAGEPRSDRHCPFVLANVRTNQANLHSLSLYAAPQQRRTGVMQLLGACVWKVPLHQGCRSLIAPPLSTAFCLLLLLSPCQGHGSLRGQRMPPQHPVRSTGAATNWVIEPPPMVRTAGQQRPDRSIMEDGAPVAMEPKVHLSGTISASC